MWILLASLVCASMAQFFPVNPSCTNAKGEVIARATACPDKTPAFCPKHFGMPVMFGMRSNECNDPVMKQFATEHCMSHCGYCCEDPKYNCVNNPNGLKCKDFADQCESSWKPVIAKYCPNVCGFCLEQDCKDTATNCDNLKKAGACISPDPMVIQQVKATCAKTCNLCDVATPTVAPPPPTLPPPTTPRLPTGTCFDVSDLCYYWIRNQKAQQVDFCTNPWNVDRGDVQLCRFSCKFC